MFFKKKEALITAEEVRPRKWFLQIDFTDGRYRTFARNEVKEVPLAVRDDVDRQLTNGLEFIEINDSRFRASKIRSYGVHQELPRIPRRVPPRHW